MYEFEDQRYPLLLSEFSDFLLLTIAYNSIFKRVFKDCSNGATYRCRVTAHFFEPRKWDIFVDPEIVLN